MVTPTVLRTLPTKLVDGDLLEFAPLEVITRGDIRKSKVKSVKGLMGVAATAVVGVVLFRGFKEAQDHLNELEATAKAGS